MSVKIFTYEDCIPRFRNLSLEEIGSVHLIESPTVRLESSVLFYDTYTQRYKILKTRLPEVPRDFIETKSFFIEHQIIESFACNRVPDIFILRSMRTYLKFGEILSELHITPRILILCPKLPTVLELSRVSEKLQAPKIEASTPTDIKFYYMNGTVTFMSRNQPYEYMLGYDITIPIESTDLMEMYKDDTNGS